MDAFYIGDLDRESIASKPAAQVKFEKAYRELRSRLVMMGMFNAK